MASLREQMPEVAAFIDEVRQRWPRALVDRQIKAGLAGKGSFYAATLQADGTVLEVGSTHDRARAHAQAGELLWSPRLGIGWVVPEPRHLWKPQK